MKFRSPTKAVIFKYRFKQNIECPVLNRSSQFRFIRVFYPAFKLTNVVMFIWLVFFFWGSKAESAEKPEQDYFGMSIEDLMNIEVTSVSKKSQKISEAAAAIFVITQEDIRRSGVTTIPEALRMAPGVEVARIDANKWAITCRGFNELYSSKLLVLIDGRTVYTPLFSGVYWDVQDTLLEDIQRIEVIRGPGATLWGANAVNGVINIITKSAKETQGGLVTAGGGTEEKGFGGVRYGGKLDENTYYRVYAKYFNRDNFVLESGGNGSDEWDSLRSGFRLDRQVSDINALTVMGDIYDGDSEQRITIPDLPSFTMQTIKDTMEVSGGNLLTRWNHIFSETSEMSLQLYYDRTKRESIQLDETRDTLDFDFQHYFSLSDNHDITWGLGYRYTKDKTAGSFAVSFNPDSRHDNLFSAFIQDKIELIEGKLHVTWGSKFEYNDYSGFEYQPSVRALWTPHERHSTWAGVSRAVRTPARSNADIRINFATIPVNMVIAIFGDEDFDSEEVIAYEIGYRCELTAHLSVDMTAFYNTYDNLLTSEPGSLFFDPSPLPHMVIPFYMGNKMDGHTYGAEVAAIWNITEKWKVTASYSYLQIQLHSDSSNMAIDAEEGEGDSPHNRFHLQSCLNLPYRLEFDQSLYYVDNLPTQHVPKYFRLDLRLGWHPTEKVELSICGQNLLDSQHSEFVDYGGNSPREIERSVYGKIAWKF